MLLLFMSCLKDYRACGSRGTGLAMQRKDFTQIVHALLQGKNRNKETTALKPVTGMAVNP